mmetsp:Transcript_25842/g.39610  ORF Transcript_25842/g.39610 Transcript_25842/m.39610 type:complete len:195 (-) Transcript_25842:14-598(-)|eukprot:CAMPEP_0194094134 /NCGR_PEP_ID=MMETSP0149-20130528/52856_1 /TAXON_ID=122233 /ORGANISM="Chaetoceros debilis, Strain MM31A-1" /LENGTH=194 /DNA_ID=CAMNT_0038779679 /DNA_START=54 /DNA_END=638 /DNA_ORIENTATION=+
MNIFKIRHHGRLSIISIVAVLQATIFMMCPLSVRAFSIFTSPVSRYQNCHSEICTRLLDSPQEVEASEEDNQEGQNQQEIDINAIATIAEINQISRSIGGPVFNSEDNSLDIESARDQLWDFVVGKAEDDIDKMCMGQLAGLMVEIGGEDFEDGTTIERARDQVWEMACASGINHDDEHSRRVARGGSSCSCCN